MLYTSPFRASCGRETIQLCNTHEGAYNIRQSGDADRRVAPSTYKGFGAAASHRCATRIIMFKQPFVRASRWPRSIRCGGPPLALILLSVLLLAGCAPESTTPLPPATSLVATSVPPATLAPPPTAAVQPSKAAQPTNKPASQPTQAALSAANTDLLVTVLHTNDVGGETDPCG